MSKSIVAQAAGTTSTTIPGTSLRITDMPAIIAALQSAVDDCSARPKGAAVTLKEGVGSTTVNQAGLKPVWTRALVASLPISTEQERSRKALAQTADAKNADGLYIPAGDMLAGLKVLLFQAKYLDEKALMNASDTSLMTEAKTRYQLIAEAMRATDRKARLASVALAPFTAPSPYQLARNPELFEQAMSRLAADQARVESVQAERHATHAATLEKAAANKPAPVAAPRITMIPELAEKVALVQGLNRRFCLNLAALVGCGYGTGSGQMIESFDVSTEMSIEDLKAIEPEMVKFENFVTREVKKVWDAMVQSALAKETAAKKQAVALAKSELTRKFAAFNAHIGRNDAIKLPEGVELISSDVRPRTNRQAVIKSVGQGVDTLTVMLPLTAVRAPKNAPAASSAKATSASA
jgi:hypothetical protein